ncbi:MAG: dihydropteroate synthase, partial [Providencia alcalifaciens]|nr:dihydropteroate synthase [Providencia alcalifaciens]
MHIKARGRLLDLSTPQVMGILNVTPDSFSDGGTHNRYHDAL